LYAPRLEPFGYAPLEANACGVPVVAVAEGGMRETIQDGLNGLMVEHDPERMAAAIERLMVDDELAQRLSRDAYCLTREKWSFSASIDRLESRLRSTLAKTREKIEEPSMDRAKSLF
jgi:glycosyltransferase involved in cell wall biosynthesis